MEQTILGTIILKGFNIHFGVSTIDWKNGNFDPFYVLSADEELDDYLVNDLSIKYNLWNTYNLFFDINNIFDAKYETVRDYSQMDRSFNFGIRRVY